MNLEKYFVIRDCTQDSNFISEDFSHACEIARKIACKYYGNDKVLIPAIIYYKENEMPKYVGICKAKSRDDACMTWWSASGNLIYALENNLL